MEGAFTSQAPGLACSLVWVRGLHRGLLVCKALGGPLIPGEVSARLLGRGRWEWAGGRRAGGVFQLTFPPPPPSTPPPPPATSCQLGRSLEERSAKRPK